MLRRALVASAVVLTLGVSPEAQIGEAPRLPHLIAWLDAVEDHRPGELDDAARLVGAYTTGDFEALWADMHALFRVLGRKPLVGFNYLVNRRRVPRKEHTDAEMNMLYALGLRVEGRGGLNRLLKHGAMLHTDVSLMTMARPDGDFTYSRYEPQRLVLEVNDGERRGLNFTAPHLEFARTLLDQIAPKQPVDPFIPLWYRATMTYLHGDERYDMPHVTRAMELFPNDAAIALLAGCLHEALASSRLQLGLRALPLPGGVTLRIGRPSFELGRARALFERALEIDPTFIEARLRLGRILSLQGRQPAALIELERATVTTDPLLRYYGRLFTGAAEDARRNFPAARTAYEQAVALYPRAQAPRLALARLAHVVGEPDESQRQVALLTRLPAEDSSHDPWWAYHRTPGRMGVALMTQIRRQLAEPSQN